MSTDLYVADGSPAAADTDAVVIGLLPANGEGTAPRLAPPPSRADRTPGSAWRPSG